MIQKKDAIAVYIVMGALLLFLVGMGVGSVLTKVKPADENNKLVTEQHKNGKLTSPLLACEIAKNTGNKEFILFEKKLEELINTYRSQGKITTAAVYYRHLMDGAWFGINEDIEFTPSSLLKVPNMIALYKIADADPTILKKELTYDKTYYTGTPHFGTNTSLVSGNSYIVGDLISRMITQSDNEAMFLLRDKFDVKIFNILYSDLGIKAPDDTVSDDFMTIKMYAAFFRILYNASYVSQNLSEEALTLLTQVSFDQGLKAGIPTNMPIAHKFGERTYVESNNKQLHDCGIIYHPTEPYLLCVMTKGRDFDALSGAIRDISKSVWDEVSSSAQQEK